MIPSFAAQTAARSPGTPFRDDDDPLAPERGAVRRIMVIDDSPTVRKILEVGLRRAGFAVVCFPDGVEALYWLRSPDGVLPDLVLLDIQLPRMDGYKVAQVLRRDCATAAIPIVMVSQYNGVLDRLKGRLAGANTYLTKPFKIDEVIGVVCEQLGIPQVRLYPDNKSEQREKSDGRMRVRLRNP